MKKPRKILKPFVIRDIHKDICRIVLMLDSMMPDAESVRQALYGAPYRHWQVDAFVIYSQMYELLEREYLAGTLTGGCKITQKGIDLLDTGGA